MRTQTRRYSSWWLLIIAPMGAVVIACVLGPSVREASHISRRNAIARHCCEVVDSYGGYVELTSGPTRPLVRLFSGQARANLVHRVYLTSHRTELCGSLDISVPVFVYPHHREDLNRALLNVENSFALDVRDTDFNWDDLAALKDCRIARLVADRANLTDEPSRIQLPTALTTLLARGTAIGDDAACMLARHNFDAIYLERAPLGERGRACLYASGASFYP